MLEICLLRLTIRRDRAANANNKKVKLEKHFRNIVIQEEVDDTESK